MSNKKKIKIKKIKIGKKPTAKQLKELDNYTSFGDMMTSTRPIQYKSSGGKIKGYSAGGKVTATNYKGCGANIVGTK
jgi:hypothetical protein